ncbi:hypothetical protein MCOR25_009343 [Pyricularia grisea]|nr:hypothetical protein MCOR25_009343 [Pyricularia grisea]
MPRRTQGQVPAAQIPLPQRDYQELHRRVEEAEDAFRNCSDIWWLHPAEFDEMRRLLDECKLLIESEQVGNLLPAPRNKEEAQRLKAQRVTMVYDRLALVWRLLEFLPLTIRLRRPW